MLRVKEEIFWWNREFLRGSNGSHCVEISSSPEELDSRATALALDVTQAYLSMMEKGYRPLSERFVRKALNLPVTALPLQSDKAPMLVSSHKRDFSAELRALGYPGFSYLRGRRRRNPVEVLLEALNEPNLDARVAEGLPWLAMTL